MYRWALSKSESSHFKTTNSDLSIHSSDGTSVFSFSTKSIICVSGLAIEISY